MILKRWSETLWTDCVRAYSKRESLKFSISKSDEEGLGCGQSKNIRNFRCYKCGKGKFFVGSMTSETGACTAVINVIDKSITFKLDTGADVTALLQRAFSSSFFNAQ